MLGVCTCASSVLVIAGAYVSDAAIPLMSTSPTTDRSSAVAANEDWCGSSDGDSCDEDGCDDGICEEGGWLW